MSTYHPGDARAVPLQPGQLRVLVACEYSATVRVEFERMGHYAVSCDLLPTEVAGLHYQGDVRDILLDGWDLMIGHPECTYMTLAGVRWLFHPDDTALPPPQRRPHPKFPCRWQQMEDGAAFFRLLWEAPIPYIALENPVMHGYAVEAVGVRQTQSVQPWQFGQGETKRVCLWLRNLPPLHPTDVVEGREARVFLMPPGPDRAKERSRFFSGIGAAMADQWTAHILRCQ